MADSILFKNIGQLVTLAPLASAGRVTSITADDLGVHSGAAWMAVAAGKIAAVGSGQPPAAYADYQRRDMNGALVLPGLVDAHTHPLYAGNRAHEFSERLLGATYQDIAARGGGILSTVRATRQATPEELLALLVPRLSSSLRHGITTLEAKSGYGLSVAAEIKMLRVLQAAKQATRQTLAVTCLALHAKSPEYSTLTDYVAACINELLPAVAQENLADWVDAFIDQGYFSVADVEPYVRCAQDLGLGVRLHADEFFDVGAAAAAADWGAASADHLQYVNAAGVAKLAKHGIVAILLPGTSLYTRIPYADGKRLFDAQVPLAIATDFNPGSCQIDNLPMLAGVAALHAGVPPAAALAGVTYVAAYSLRLHRRKGALLTGYDADFLVHPAGSWQEWLGDFGRCPPREVWIGGKQASTG